MCQTHYGAAILAELAALLSNHEKLSAAYLAQDMNGRVRTKDGAKDNFTQSRLAAILERIEGPDRPA